MRIAKMKTTNHTITQEYLRRYAELSLSDSEDFPFLGALKREAEGLLRQNPLPATHSEDYQRFDIDTALSGRSKDIDPDFIPDLSRFSGRACFFGLEENAITAFITNGTVHDISDSGSPEKGFFIGSLRDFAEIYPELPKKYLGTMSSLREDPLAQLNTLFMSDALVIYFAPGTRIDRPIHLLHRTAVRREGHSISFPRLLIIAEDGAEARILSCVHGYNPGIYALQNAVTELYVGERSHVEYYLLEETLPKVTRIHEIHSTQSGDSRLLINNLTIRNGISRTNYRCDLTGEGADLNLDGLAILDGNQVADNHSLIRHSVPRCHSDELFKYTINDEARGAFSGMIYVAKDAQETVAYQNNRNLLLSEKARMYSKPQLEIYADDVKCSHGLTTGQLDDNGLFYLRQRGIPLSEAMVMMTIAFMGDVIDRISLPVLRERLLQLVEDRYRGKHTLCGERSTEILPE